MRYQTYLPEENKHYEGAFAQGNGYLKLRASFEEDLSCAPQDEVYWRLPANVTLEAARNPVSKWGIYIPGIYGNHPVLLEELVNLPYFLGLNLYQQGERFDMSTSSYREFEKSFCLEDGVLERRFLWQAKDGNLDVKFHRYASMQNMHFTVQEISLCAHSNLHVTIESFVDAGVTTNGYCHFNQVQFPEVRDGIEVLVSLDSGQCVGMKSITDFRGLPCLKRQPGPEDAVHWNRKSEFYELDLREGERVSFYKYSWAVTSLEEEFCQESPQGWEQEKELLHRLLNKQQEQAAGLELSVHQKEWEKLWKHARVVVTGNEKLQEALDFSIYHLLRAFPWNSSAAIDAKGFAGEAYFGHYFWDTEIYLLPFFIYTHPQKAKALLEYRFRMLEGARENARHYGYPGARYPWESCATGREQCSNWQYADLEVHVSADIIYGLWHYGRVTGDQEFLLDQGLSMMVETARYWCARAELKDGAYHLCGVMGPDEYLAFTDNNAYTNYMVKFALEKTLQAIGMADNKKKEALKLTAEECKKFREVKEKLVFPEDKEKHFIWQCDRFEDFGEVDFERIWKDRTKPFGTFISQEKNYRSKALKQADTLSLFALFPEAFDRETKENCLAYYEPMTTHDSSLSYVIHSLVYAGLCKPQKAYEYMEKSMGIDLYKKGAAEGIHIANAGGLYQAVVFGLAGFRGFDEKGSLQFSPALPDSVKQLECSLCIRGTYYRAVISREQVICKKEENDAGNF